MDDTSDLSMSEQYLLSQILVCGKILPGEIFRATGFCETVFSECMRSLSEQDVLEETLYEYATKTDHDASEGPEIPQV